MFEKLSGRRDLNPRPLDPQDVGLGICAGQPGNGGGVLGDPTCGLSGRMHGVWSPGRPQGSDRFRPAGPPLANYGRHGQRESLMQVTGRGRRNSHWRLRCDHTRPPIRMSRAIMKPAATIPIRKAVRSFVGHGGGGPGG